MKKPIGLMCTICLVIGMAGLAQAKDKIVFGQSTSLSGFLAKPTHYYEVPLTKLWLQEVNAKGGIYVPDYGKRLPVELIRYDDKSDVATMIKLTERLITVDKVDILLGPLGTTHHLAVAPLATRYKYPIVGYTNATEKLYDMQDKYPYMFVTINSPRQGAEGFKDLAKDLGIKKAAIIYASHEFGIEYASCNKSRFEAAGIDLVMYKSYPLPATDLSPLLKEAKAANVDALIAHSLAQDTFMLPEQAKGIKFNPKLFYVAIGGAWPAFKGKYGNEMVEGITGPGGWNQNMPIPGAKEFYDKFVAMHGRPPCNWSTACGYSVLQILEHAIENVGLKDGEKLRNFIANEPHETAFGTVKFEGGQFNTNPPALIGQWQKGMFECLMPKKSS
ncbi:MAG: amino acid ABC transporter substrate-binding protein, partial [Candidatus Hodarchaeota archaeon]